MIKPMPTMITTATTAMTPQIKSIAPFRCVRTVAMELSAKTRSAVNEGVALMCVLSCSSRD